MTQLKNNPRRPPKQWMRNCIAGVKDSGSAANPGAVCGSLWYQKMSSAQRRAALAKEGLRGNPEIEISQEPLSSADKAVLWTGGLALLAAVAWWAFKPKESNASPSAAPVPSPPPSLVPAVSCTFESDKLEAWAKARGFYLVHVGAILTYSEMSESAKSQPLTILQHRLTDDAFYTYDFTGAPPLPTPRNDLRDEYCATTGTVAGLPLG